MARPRALLAEDHKGMAAELRKLLETEFDVVAIDVRAACPGCREASGDPGKP